MKSYKKILLSLILLGAYSSFNTINSMEKSSKIYTMDDRPEGIPEDTWVEIIKWPTEKIEKIIQAVKQDKGKEKEQSDLTESRWQIFPEKGESDQPQIPPLTETESDSYIKARLKNLKFIFRNSTQYNVKLIKEYVLNREDDQSLKIEKTSVVNSYGQVYVNMSIKYLGEKYVLNKIWVEYSSSYIPFYTRGINYLELNLNEIYSNLLKDFKNNLTSYVILSTELGMFKVDISNATRLEPTVYEKTKLRTLVIKNKTHERYREMGMKEDGRTLLVRAKIAYGGIEGTERTAFKYFKINKSAERSLPLIDERSNARVIELGVAFLEHKLENAQIESTTDEKATVYLAPDKTIDANNNNSFKNTIFYPIYIADLLHDKKHSNCKKVNISIKASNTYTRIGQALQNFFYNRYGEAKLDSTEPYPYQSTNAPEWSECDK